jgi:hypothetical protein
MESDDLKKRFDELIVEIRVKIDENRLIVDYKMARSALGGWILFRFEPDPKELLKEGAKVAVRFFTQLEEVKKKRGLS